MPQTEKAQSVMKQQQKHLWHVKVGTCVITREWMNEQGKANLACKRSGKHCMHVCLFMRLTILRKGWWNFQKDKQSFVASRAFAFAQLLIRPSIHFRQPSIYSRQAAEHLSKAGGLESLLSENVTINDHPEVKDEVVKKIKGTFTATSYLCHRSVIL